MPSCVREKVPPGLLAAPLDLEQESTGLFAAFEELAVEVGVVIAFFE